MEKRHYRTARAGGSACTDLPRFSVSDTRGLLWCGCLFVISGYLISGIIFRGIASSSFSYLEFYEKRIKRIIPNLILLLTFVAAAGWFILLPDEYANLGMHIDASTLFIQNFQLLSEIGYFTEDALRKPLLHL